MRLDVMSRNSNSTKSEGYTLIELLVGIVIITIIFTIGYAGFREFSRRQSLTGATKIIIADLRLIQQLALTGQKPTGATCRKLVGYSFQWVNNTSYNLNASCDNTLTGTPSIVSVQLKSVTLPTGVLLTAPATNPILFKVLGQGTNLLTSNSLNLTSTAAGTSGQITIGVGGNVQSAFQAGATSQPLPTPTATPVAPTATPLVATPTPTATPSCITLNFVSGSASPGTVTNGGAYTINCTYGAQTNGIMWSSNAGNCTFSSWSGNTAIFNCIAGATDGTFVNRCRIIVPNSQNYCARLDSINSIIVQ